MTSPESGGRDRFVYPATSLAACAGGSVSAASGTPFTRMRPGHLLRRNKKPPAAQRWPQGAAGQWPAAIQTFGGRWPAWGWLKHRHVELPCLGRPTLVGRGDVLLLAEADGQPETRFLVLDELIPTRVPAALCLLGYELDASNRVTGPRKELYVVHPQAIEAVLPGWRTAGIIGWEDPTEDDDSSGDWP